MRDDRVRKRVAVLFGKNLDLFGKAFRPERDRASLVKLRCGCVDGLPVGFREVLLQHRTVDAKAFGATVFGLVNRMEHVVPFDLCGLVGGSGRGIGRCMTADKQKAAQQK